MLKDLYWDHFAVILALTMIIALIIFLALMIPLVDFVFIVFLIHSLD